jgi:hypothetical protein
VEVLPRPQSTNRSPRSNPLHCRGGDARIKEVTAMGKLVDKLHRVSQGAGATFGFLGGRSPAQKPRPAALLVSVDVADAAVAEAALKNGADGLILTNWTPQAGLGAMKSLLEAKDLVWGVDLTASAGDAGVLKGAAETGAGFALLGPGGSARILFEEVDKFDLIGAIEMPTSELGLLLIRGQNLLPVQVGLLQPEIAPREVARMTVADYARLRLVIESLRFPVLLALQTAPEVDDVKTLVHLGVAGVVLKGQGAAAQTFGAQVKTLRETLEKTPAPKEDRENVLISGLMPMPQPATPGQPPREPERDPDRE